MIAPVPAGEPDVGSGKATVKSPAVAVLVPPKSNTTTNQSAVPSTVFV